MNGSFDFVKACSTLPENKFYSVVSSYLELRDLIKLASSSQFTKKIINKNNFLDKIKQFKLEYNVTLVKPNKIKKEEEKLVSTAKTTFMAYLKNEGKLMKNIKRKLKLNSFEEKILLCHKIREEFDFISNYSPKHLANLDYSGLNLSPYYFDIIIAALSKTNYAKSFNFSNIDFTSIDFNFSSLLNLIRSNSNLESITLSNNKLNDKLTKKLFSYSLIYLSHLNSLDLSNNEISKNSIEEFFDKILQNNFNSNTQTSQIIFKSNLLGSKGLSKLISCSGLSKLDFLDISYNGLAFESGVILEQLFLKFNSNNISTNKLNSIDLSGNYLTDKGVIDLIKGLQRNNSLSKLILDDNRITDFGLNALSDCFDLNNKLVTLSLNKNCIGSKGLLSLSQTLKIKSNVKYLYLGENEITLIGVKYLTSYTDSNKSLLELSLENNNLGIERNGKNADSCINSNNINKNNNTNHTKKSSISANSVNLFSPNPTNQVEIKEDVYSILKSLIIQNSSILKLNLSSCNINKGIKYLSQGLINNKTLNSLDLSNNYLNCDSCNFISDILIKNSVLENLKLDFNIISDVGCCTLASSFKRNKTIKVLNLNYNLKISEKGVLSFKEFIKTNSVIMEITFQGISKEVEKCWLNNIEDTLKLNRNLKKI